MSRISAELVPTPGQETAFKVVYKKGDLVLSESPVNSVEEGEREMNAVLSELERMAAEKEGSPPRGEPGGAGGQGRGG